jgi:hypothetical protein
MNSSLVISPPTQGNVNKFPNIIIYGNILQVVTPELDGWLGETEVSTFNVVPSLI